MNLKHYVFKYCKENNISWQDFVSKRGLHPNGFKNNYKTSTLKSMMLFDDILRNDKDFKKEIAYKIRIKLSRFTEFDVERIPDDLCLQIYELLFDYRKKDLRNENN